MKKTDKKVIVTPSEILKVFNHFLLKNAELLACLKEYYGVKYGVSMPTIKILMRDMQKNEFFKGVSNHVNTFYSDEHNSDYFAQHSTTDKGRLCKILSQFYITLKPQYEEEKNLPELNSYVDKTKSELGSNLYGNNEDGKIPEKVDIYQKANITKELTLVYQWYNMDMFIGRNNELRELENKIQKQKNVIINGIRGIGKTGLVQAYLNKNARYYDHIIWVPVYNDLKSSLIVTLKDSVAFHQSIIITDSDTRRTFENILYALNQYQGNNLIIFDNAGSPDQIKEIISIFRKINSWSWKTIFTTHANIKRPKPIELERLSPNDAINVFKAYYLEDVSPEETEEIEVLFAKEEQQIKEMLRKINYHTLLIELIAKVDIEDEMLTLHNLFQIIKDTSAIKSKRLKIAVQPNIKNTAADAIRPDELTPYKYIKAIFEKDLENLTDEQKQLLLFFSVLPAKPISIKEITIFLGIGEDELLYRLNNLKGWLKFDEQTQSYTIEELYQFAIKELLIPTEENCGVLIENIENAIKSIPQKRKKKPGICFYFNDYLDTIHANCNSTK